MTAPVDLTLLETLYQHMRGRVTYLLGAKADNEAGCPAGPRMLDEDSSTIVRIDCSGFTRYILHRATQGALTLPDGSANQRDWCDRHLRKLARYSDVQYAAADPSRLFIAFISPNSAGVGHVWLVRSTNGAMWTRESHGHVGVDSRPWDVGVLLANASACYELPTA